MPNGSPNPDFVSSFIDLCCLAARQGPLSRPLSNSCILVLVLVLVLLFVLDRFGSSPPMHADFAPLKYQISNLKSHSTRRFLTPALVVTHFTLQQTIKTNQHTPYTRKNPEYPPIIHPAPKPRHLWMSLVRDQAVHEVKDNAENNHPDRLPKHCLWLSHPF